MHEQVTPLVGMSFQTLFHLCMDRMVSEPIQVNPTIRSERQCVNLGHGSKEMPYGVVSIGLPEWDANKDPLPYEDESVDEIWALHFLEHIDRPENVLHECQRVLRQGGLMTICVPYGASHLAVQDITHRHMFNEDTWITLFRNPYYDPTGQGHSWTFDVYFNMIMAIKGENLALITQLIKE